MAKTGSIYQFTETRLPSAGAYPYAFEMGIELPILRRIGPGVPSYSCMKPLQPPQYQQQLRIALAGYGGLSAGMLYGTALTVDPLGMVPAQGSLG